MIVCKCVQEWKKMRKVSQSGTFCFSSLLQGIALGFGLGSEWPQKKNESLPCFTVYYVHTPFE